MDEIVELPTRSSRCGGRHAAIGSVIFVAV
jgi:hypothetical protein